MKVPELTAPDVAPAPLPTPFNGNRATPEAFGAELAGPVNQAGSIIAGLAKQYRDRATADRVINADTQFGHTVNEAEWSPDSETDAGGNKTGVAKGFMLKLGQNALDPSKHLQSLEEARDDISDSLKDNPEAQRTFLVRAAARLEHARQQAETHSGQQMQVVGAATADAQQKLAIDTIALAHGTPDQVKAQTDQAVALATGPLLHHMENNQGLPADAVAARMTDFRSQAYAKAIQVKLDEGDGLGAKELYEKTADKLGALAPQVEKSIRPMVLQQQAGLEANRIIQQSYVAGGRVDEAKATALWEEMEETPLKEKTLELLKSRTALHNQAQEKQEEQVFGRVVQDIEHHGGILNESSQDFRALSDAGKGRALEKSRTILRSLRRDARQDDAADRRAQADANRDAINTFNGLENDAQTKADISSLFPGADKTTQDYIRVLQKKANDTQKKGQVPQAAEFNAVVKAAAEQVGLPKQAGADLTSHMVEWKNQYEVDHPGKAPTREELNAELARSLKFGKTGYIFGKKFEFQAEKAGEGDKFKAAAPEDQKFAPNRTPAPAKPAAAPQGFVPRVKKDGTPVWFNPSTGEARPR